MAVHTLSNHAHLIPTGLNDCLIIDFKGDMSPPGLNDCLIIDFKGDMSPPGVNDCIIIDFQGDMSPPGLNECLIIDFKGDVTVKKKLRGDMVYLENNRRTWGRRDFE